MIIPSCLLIAFTFYNNNSFFFTKLNNCTCLTRSTEKLVHTSHCYLQNQTKLTHIISGGYEDPIGPVIMTKLIL